jgi:hypothetical protein
MAPERPRDLYPLMTLEYVVKALKVLFGNDDVISDKGEIRLRIRYPGYSKPSSVSLTIEQAKFVVARSISAKDLIDEKYPADWPGGARTIPRPSHRGAEPLLFKDGKH